MPDTSFAVSAGGFWLPDRADDHEDRGESMSVLRRIPLRLVRLLPLTRFYGLKRGLLRLAGLSIGSGVRVVSSARFVTPFVEIGDGSFIGHECLLIAAHGSVIRLGADVDLGPRCTISTGGHQIGPPGHRAGTGTVSDVRIGDGVWLGQGVSVIGGVEVGTGSVVAAGTVLRTSVPPNSLCRPPSPKVDPIVEPGVDG